MLYPVELRVHLVGQLKYSGLRKSRQPLRILSTLCRRKSSEFRLLSGSRDDCRALAPVRALARNVPIACAAPVMTLVGDMAWGAGRIALACRARACFCWRAGLMYN